LGEKIKREGKKRIWREREMEIRKKKKKKETLRGLNAVTVGLF